MSSSDSSPRVVVTGGAGFIGSHVAEHFEQEGYRVRVFDDLSSGDRANCDAGWELVVADVRDTAAVADAVDGADAVVHLAAFTSVPESFERFEDCYRINVHGTHNVLQACVQHGVRKLVFASSAAVYAEQPVAPKSEAECPDPVSPYGVSKLEGEHLLSIFGEAHGLSSVALRFFNVYGPRQAANSAYAAAVPIFMERGLRRDPLLIYGDGQQTRDFVFVKDVADAVLRASLSEATGVFNVGTGREVSVVQLADTIVELTDGDPAHCFEAKRPGDIRSSTADISRIASEVGWKPGYTLAEGLAATLPAYRGRPRGRGGRPQGRGERSRGRGERP